MEQHAVGASFREVAQRVGSSSASGGSDEFTMRQITTISSASSSTLPLGKALLILIKAEPKSLRFGSPSAHAAAASVSRALDSLTATLHTGDGAAAMRSVSSALLEQVGPRPTHCTPLNHGHALVLKYPRVLLRWPTSAKAADAECGGSSAGSSRTLVSLLVLLSLMEVVVVVAST